MPREVTNTLLKEQYPTHDIGEGSYGPLMILHYGATSKLKIGNYCSFAAGTALLLGASHRMDAVSTYPFEHREIREDIEIGSDVWVGLGATILGGARIGDGAVIAAGSVVSGWIAPFAVVGGNPVRFMRWRFEEQVRDALLKLAWWDWPTERIERAKPLLSGKPQDFFNAIAEGRV